MAESYRSYTSSDGWTILVGKNARDNDLLTFKIAKPHDFWLHIAPTSGSHVIVQNPDQCSRLPKTTLKEAAALAVFFSRSREGGRVDVHYTQRQYVQKARGAPAGQVQLLQFETTKASPLRDLPPDFKDPAEESNP
ncbi:NFACT RNA binding domain-containing protein [Myxococcota bacterium]|nr:NFACT RNA binding domain-containing protein [Myxococcota bacterium]